MDNQLVIAATCGRQALVARRFRQQLLFALMACAGMAAQAQTTGIPAGERAALQAIYSATHGGAWTARTGWNGAVGTECDWVGITCDDSLSHVIGIDLSQNNLIGSLPNSLVDLTSLQSVDFSENQLTGAIPTLAGLKALQSFDANSNELSGGIPALTGLTLLEYLDFSGNQLTGAIPDLADPTKLQYFDVSNNQLTGGIPGLGKLVALQEFYVENNLLSGSIPELGALAALQEFDVSGNQLSGTIPALLSRLTGLKGFFASQNQLSGTIPALKPLAELRTFDVQSNELGGAIPAIDGLAKLTQFSTDNNRLTQLPVSFGGLVALQSFTASNNQLVGTIPDLSPLTSLQNFDVSHNQLTGSIPELSKLKALKEYFLVNDNQLTGSIPDLSSLTNLQDFNANNNRLTGSIPSLSTLTSLTSFNVANNQLSGSVPAVAGSLVLASLCGNSLTQNASGAVNTVWTTAEGGWLACQVAAPTAPSLNLVTGWNLVGNGVEAPLPVASTFDAAKAKTVWKWVVSGSTPGLTYPTWAFYTPLQADGGQAYAASKGYEFLTAINAGEGFWVNAKAAFSVALGSVTTVKSASFKPVSAGAAGGGHALGHGWNLVAVGDNVTPESFDAAIAVPSAQPPAAGQVYTSLTSLWAWDATRGGWYFWAPSLVNSNKLAAYLTSKNYLDFATMPSSPSGTLSAGTGVWVSLP